MFFLTWRVNKKDLLEWKVFKRFRHKSLSIDSYIFIQGKTASKFIEKDVLDDNCRVILREGFDFLHLSINI